MVSLPGISSDDTAGWHEPDFTNEYWGGDTQAFSRTVTTMGLLNNLSINDRRDAFRTMRGSVLRTELYALDGTTRQDKPYTVTEGLHGVTEIRCLKDNTTEEMKKLISFDGLGISGYKEAPLLATRKIFFPISEGERTTQWERGTDPMTQFSFSGDYTNYGAPTRSISVAVKRGVNFANPGAIHSFLSSYSTSDFIEVDHDIDGMTPDYQFMVGRVSKAESYEIIHRTTDDAIKFGRYVIANGPNSADPLIGRTRNYYDGTTGDEYNGLSFGSIGLYGALVKSETLILTSDILMDAYGAIPSYIENTAGGTTWGSEYPSDFQATVLDYAGYIKETVGSIDYYYTQTTRNKFDFHASSANIKGMILDIKDPLGNITDITFDSYKLFPITVIDAIGIETNANYDYRVLQASIVTDPNGNRTAYAFSPLGLMHAYALIGKSTESIGDIRTTPLSAASGLMDYYRYYLPCVQMEYDFLNFINTGGPVWVKTTKRENHIQDGINDDTIVHCVYSDGFGRLIQTRTQAEELLLLNTGSDIFGSSRLPASQSGINQPAVGTFNSSTTDINVVVSGWQVYNNKGMLVEKYEPFFDTGFDFVQPIGGMGIGEKIVMFYDSQGHSIRTLNPDATEQTIWYGNITNLGSPENYDPNPWDTFTYDLNDNAGRRLGGQGLTPNEHLNTPKSVEVDCMGRAIRSVDRNWNYGTSAIDEIVMLYDYDIRSNVLLITDALGRVSFEHTYDLKPKTNKDDPGANVLWTNHIDGGEKISIFDASMRPIENKDAKGGLILHSYDPIHRPINLWVRDDSSATHTDLRQHSVFGDNLTETGFTSSATLTWNLYGKLYEQYDEAGVLVMHEYDFKGNMLTKSRWMIDDNTILAGVNTPIGTFNCYRVDWTGFSTSILEGSSYDTDMNYDALNRVTVMLYPADVIAHRAVLVQSYNKAGGLQRVELDGVPYVNEIAYNAKGQRLLIAYGNNMMTRYVYDDTNFRLLRLKSEKYTYSSYTYTPNSGTQQDFAYDYDLAGNIMSIKDITTNCGIPGTTLGQDALLREFEYDPIYRLLSATGRERISSNSLWDDYTRDDDPTMTTAYTQHYEYDKMGNMENFTHYASTSFVRSFTLQVGTNLLNSMTIGGSIYPYVFDANGNMTQENNTRYFEWNFADKMKCFHITASGSTTVYAQYLYDAGGNRIKKVVWYSSGTVKTTKYDGVLEHYIETSGSILENNLLNIMDDKKRIATIRVGHAFDSKPNVQYILSDHLDSSNVHLDSSASLVNREEFYAFGESSFGFQGKKRYRFCGKERDEETGFFDYGFRMYIPWICRFNSVDPLAEKYAHLASFSYAANKPINNIDLDGAETPGEPQSANVHASGSLDTKNKTYTAGGDSANFTDGKFNKVNNNFDTLSSVAQKATEELHTKISYQDIMSWNGITDDKSPIRPGTPLKLSDTRPVRLADPVQAKARADAAIKLEAKWVKDDVRYTSFHPDRLIISENTSWSDCVTFIAVSLMSAKQQSLFGTNRAYPMTTDMLVHMYNIENNTHLKLHHAGAKDPNRVKYDAEDKKTLALSATVLRKYKPQTGDIMMWGGHVGIITNVNKNGTVDFAMVGGWDGYEGHAAQFYPNIAFSTLLTDTVYGHGGFLGIWTPPKVK